MNQDALLTPFPSRSDGPKLKTTPSLVEEGAQDRVAEESKKIESEILGLEDFKASEYESLKELRKKIQSKVTSGESKGKAFVYYDPTKIDPEDEIPSTLKTLSVLEIP